MRIADLKAPCVTTSGVILEADMRQGIGNLENFEAAETGNGHSFPRPSLLAHAILALVVLIGLTISVYPAVAWTITSDFESGTPGANAAGASSFHEAGGRTLLSNALFNSGFQSARMEWKKGDSGFANDRGTFYFPQKINVGGQLWMRAYYYFPSPWSWFSPVSRVKVMRFHKTSSDGSHIGYIDIINQSNGEPFAGCEACRSENNFQIPPAVSLGSDRWYALELYVYYHPTNGILRMWIDGELKVEVLNINTARSTTDLMDFAYVMSYWNEGAPQDQVQYIDDIIITTDVPTKRDVKGNPMIGLNSPSPDRSPPQAPTGLRIQ